MATKEQMETARRNRIIQLAERSGLENDGKLGSTRGDWFTLSIRDYVWRKKDLRKFHTSGKYLAVICQRRKRVYATSSKWWPRTTDFHFLVGENENGHTFHHAIPNTINSVNSAWNWIWNGASIRHRQGDVGLAPSNLKHVAGSDEDTNITSGHTRHKFIGRVHHNGTLHVRNGFLYHTAGQHPTVYVGPEWMRVVIARRSEAIPSSSD